MDMNERITRALDDMTPGEAAKSRMHERLMAGANAARPTPLRPGRRRLGIALAVTVLFCATVFAATQLPQYVNWQGEPVATPDFFSGFSGEELARHEQQRQWAQRAMNLIPDPTASEYWVAYQILPDGTVRENFWTFKTIQRNFDSYEALHAAIRAEGVLLLPDRLSDHLPSGYAFDYAYATYQLPRNFSSALLDEEKAADDVMLRRYALPQEEDRFLSGYVVSFAKGREYVSIRGEVYDAANAPGYIPISQNGTARPLSIEGMDRVVLSEGESPASAGMPTMKTSLLAMRHKRMLVASSHRGSRPWDYLRVVRSLPNADLSHVWLWSNYSINAGGALLENDLIALANTFH